MRTTALLLLFAARRAAGDADKLFKGIPSACVSYDGTDVADDFACLFDCDTGGTRSAVCQKLVEID